MYLADVMRNTETKKAKAGKTKPMKLWEEENRIVDLPLDRTTTTTKKLVNSDGGWPCFSSTPALFVPSYYTGDRFVMLLLNSCQAYLQ